MAQFTTDSGLQRILTLLQSDVTHIGVQNGATAPTESSALLNGEFDRKSIVDPFIDGRTLVLDAFFAETEANGTITGFGAFGNGATATLDTGTLVAASDANIEKTTAESLTLSVELTVTRLNT
jgi:hypothetical protein